MDKNPGLYRIASKVVVSHIREDIISAVGSLQVCTGQEARFESLVRAMRAIYEDQLSDTVFLVDTSNAFDSVNRNAFLHNIIIICPPPARFVRNCYYANTRLSIIGGAETQSMEGSTQGDPAAMTIYAIAIIPLVLMLVEQASQANNTTKTAAYADDLTATGTIIRLRNWWDVLCRMGPKFGYFPEGSKSWLIVKNKDQSAFKDTNIKITTEGQRHLGAIIGSETFKQKYIQEKIDQWIKELRVL